MDPHRIYSPVQGFKTKAHLSSGNPEAGLVAFYCPGQRRALLV